MEHRINLQSGTCPVHQIPYRKGPEMGEVTYKNIGEQLLAGVIEQDNCEWASSVVSVPNNDGKIRF